MKVTKKTKSAGAAKSIFDRIADPAKFAEVFDEEFKKAVSPDIPKNMADIYAAKKGVTQDTYYDAYLDTLLAQICSYIQNDVMLTLRAEDAKSSLLCMLLNALGNASHTLNCDFLADQARRDDSISYIVLLLSNLNVSNSNLIEAFNTFSFSLMENAITLQSEVVTNKLLQACPEVIFSDVAGALFNGDYTGTQFSELKLEDFLELPHVKQLTLSQLAINELELKLENQNNVIVEEIVKALHMCSISYDNTERSAFQACRLLAYYYGDIHSMDVNAKGKRLIPYNSSTGIDRSMSVLGRSIFGKYTFLTIKDNLIALDLAHDASSWFNFLAAGKVQIDNVKLPDMT